MNIEGRWKRWLGRGASYLAIGTAAITIAGLTSHRANALPRHASEVAGIDIDTWLVLQAGRPPHSPQRLHVNPETGDDRRGNGSLARPFRTITHALELASPQTIVQLAPGTYSAATGEQFPIVLRPQVTLYGDPENWGTDIEIVGGGRMTTQTAGEQSATLLGVDGAGLRGVTVRNPHGSAIWVTGGSPWIIDNTLIGNARHGIAAHEGQPHILNNRFDDNDGADIELSERATPQLQNNQFDIHNSRSLAYFGAHTDRISAPAASSVRSSPIAAPDGDGTTSVSPSDRPIQTDRPNNRPEIVAWQREPEPPSSASIPGPTRVQTHDRAPRSRSTLPRQRRDSIPTDLTTLPLDPDLQTVRASRVQNLERSPAAPAASPAPSRARRQPEPRRDRAEPDFLSWGTNLESSEDIERSATAETSERPAQRIVEPESLLRWNGLTASEPAGTTLPPPVVDPTAASRTAPQTDAARSSARTPTRQPLRSSAPIAAEPIEIERRPAAVSQDRLSQLPTISGPIPLPVPDAYPPIGHGDALPPLLATTNPGDPPPPPGLVPGASGAPAPTGLGLGLRYRLLVDNRADLERVRAIARDVIVTEIDGSSVLQAGAFRDRWRAEQLQAELQAAGLTAWIVEIN